MLLLVGIGERNTLHFLRNLTSLRLSELAIDRDIVVAGIIINFSGMLVALRKLDQKKNAPSGEVQFS